MLSIQIHLPKTFTNSNARKDIKLPCKGKAAGVSQSNHARLGIGKQQVACVASPLRSSSLPAARPCIKACTRSEGQFTIAKLANRPYQMFLHLLRSLGYDAMTWYIKNYAI
jgi:hypothetical protein